MSEFNLEARWVKFSERWPEAEETVLARDFKSDNIVAAYAEDDECYTEAAMVFNGEYYMRRDELNAWEWLELRPKEKPEPPVPLPDGIHEVTLPDGRAALVSDSGGYYCPAVPLPDGRTLGVLEALSESIRLQNELNDRLGADKECFQYVFTIPDGSTSNEEHEMNSEKMIPSESAPAIPRDVEPSSLSEMFRLQHHLNSRIGADMVDVDAVGDKEAIARWTQKFVTAMQQELAELVDCVPWKWWRPEEAQPYDRQNARVEIVDLFHFLISLAQLHGMSAEDVYNTYRAKCQINHKRQDSGYLKKDPDDCRGI